jgi:hypothetical protein
MRTWLCRLVILALPLLASAASQGSPLDFDLGGYDKPSVLQGVNRPRACTIAWLLQDSATNDTFVARMQFYPAPNAVPMNGRLACPSLVPPAVVQAALDGCRAHAENKSDCVFADMSRGFRATPGIGNTVEDASRCASDHASQIAIACVRSGGSDVCNVGCGEDPAAAIAAARTRCEAVHQTACGITGVLPVPVPSPGQ